jgi:tetratricopeptide (TPR) repeat protein
MPTEKGPPPYREAEAIVFGLVGFSRSPLHPSLKQSEAVPVARLMYSVYLRFRCGVLVSQTDAARLMGWEHRATAKHYIDIVERLGFIQIKEAERDSRINLLVPTEAGFDAVMGHAHVILSELIWFQNVLAGRFYDAYKMREDLVEIFPLGATLSSSKTEQYQDTRGPGVQLYEDAAGVIPVYTETLKLFPRHIEALIQRGAAYIHTKEYDKALEDIDAALKIDQTKVAAWEQRARRNVAAGKYRDAIKDCDQALGLYREGDTKLALHWRGLANEELGRDEDALRDMEAWAGEELSWDRMVQVLQMKERMGKLPEGPERDTAFESLRKLTEYREEDEKGPFNLLFGPQSEWLRSLWEVNRESENEVNKARLEGSVSATPESSTKQSKVSDTGKKTPLKRTRK